MKKIFEAGTHLVLDGFTINTSLLQDLDRVRAFLDEYPDRMHMTKIMPPYVFRYQGDTCLLYTSVPLRHDPLY